MKKAPTLFLKAVIYIIGLAALGLSIFLLFIVEPAKAGPYYPIVLLMVVSLIPFLFAHYQSLKLLNFIDTNNAFSDKSVLALRNIRYCGLTISGLYAVAMPYIFHVADMDDAPGVVLIGLIVIGASLVISVFAALLQKLLRNAIDIKSENELTV
jgi:hypothetical protein